MNVICFASPTASVSVSVFSENVTFLLSLKENHTNKNLKLFCALDCTVFKNICKIRIINQFHIEVGKILEPSMLEGLEDFPETFLSNFKIAPKNQASSFLARI